MDDSYRELMRAYHNFDDGLVLAFGFFYPTEEGLAARGVFYARNHAVSYEQWDTVTFVLRNVVSFHANWAGNQANSISAGVKLMKFDELWCLDVDGVYGEVEDPKSIEEVRQFGDCYVIARSIEYHVSPNRRDEFG